MRNFLAVCVLSLAVAGCPSFMQDTGSPEVDARVNTIMTVKRVCLTYVSALNVFAAAMDADEVSLAQVETAEGVKKTLDPVCSASVAPSDPSAVINQVQLGVARLLAITQRGGS